MEKDNVRTSVVIELENQGDEEEQKMNQGDLQGASSPKDYIIDQIFSGDNVTVYALFEIPDDKSKRSFEKSLLEITNNQFKDNFRFHHRNSYKQGNCSRYHEEDPKIRRNKSFYCLQSLSSNHDFPPLKKNSSEIKVLFDKGNSFEFYSSSKNETVKELVKTVSKSTNTEFSQCPKLVQQVQLAINAKYLDKKYEGKPFEALPLNSIFKRSGSFNDSKKLPETSCIKTELNNNKNEPNLSSNIFLVPLFMTHETIDNQSNKDNNKDTLNLSNTVSLGINTESHFLEDRNRQKGIK